MAVGEPYRIAAALHAAGQGALRRRHAVHPTLMTASTYGGHGIAGRSAKPARLSLGLRAAERFPFAFPLISAGEFAIDTLSDRRRFILPSGRAKEVPCGQARSGSSMRQGSRTAS